MDKKWVKWLIVLGCGLGIALIPPPEGVTPEVWFRRLFIDEPQNFALRPYDREQWDAMFFVEGNVEILLVDERVGMQRRVMRLILEGDDQRGPNNAGIILPAGVAHAFRAEGGRDAIMVYGTSMQFNPDFEGRIADSVERAPLPPDWQAYIAGS